MPTTNDEIERALTERLKQQLPPQRVAAMRGPNHTELLRDNVVTTITDAQLETLAAQLAGGDGGELTPTATGKVRAHAAYSSSALALSAFGYWLGREQQLTVHGIGGWSAPLQLEAKLPIHGAPRPANLDVLLRAPGRVLAIESKLKEYVSPHEPRGLKPVYATAAMAELLPAGWRPLLRALLDGSFACRHLDPEQLIKHALALRSQFPAEQVTLAYVYWEPAGGELPAEVVAHRRELAEFHQWLGEAAGDRSMAFVSLTYAEVLAEWAAGGGADNHMRALDERYAAS